MKTKQTDSFDTRTRKSQLHQKKMIWGLLFVISTTLMGCQSSYYLHLAKGQSELWWNRVSITSLLDSPDTKREQRKKLEWILASKAFAEKNLLLKPGKNYSSFVQLDRKAVSWVVVAAPKWKIEAKQWSFPIVGTFPYKGFFALERAQAEAQSLRAEGLDAAVRPVSAFSYLGWISDPVFSTFLDMEDADLAELIFHESVHATFFVENQVDFNEQLASFVAEVGLEQWMSEQLSKEKFASWKKATDQHRLEEEKFNGFLNQEIRTLQSAYDSAQEKVESQRLQLWEKMKERYVSLKFETAVGSWLVKSEPNNAILTGFATYNQKKDRFEKLFNKSNRNWNTFWSALHGLKKSPNPWDDLEKLL